MKNNVYSVVGFFVEASEPKTFEKFAVREVKRGLSSRVEVRFV